MYVRDVTRNARAADTCDHCEGSDGRPKNSYPSRAAAESTAAYIQSQGGPRLRAYECPWTPAWHLTKSR